ncbi:hypothetical protein POX_e06623 [Penicillium oxalicum]|nr:hypothetical protein POX_e06623 [Penicillium oxalicum]KAI2788603.1 hypothetical protein POX_e06623 [Penicillium oxalicum]
MQNVRDSYAKPKGYHTTNIVALNKLANVSAEGFD